MKLCGRCKNIERSNRRLRAALRTVDRIMSGNDGYEYGTVYDHVDPNPEEVSVADVVRVAIADKRGNPDA